MLIATSVGGIATSRESNLAKQCCIPGCSNATERLSCPQHAASCKSLQPAVRLSQQDAPTASKKLDTDLDDYFKAKGEKKGKAAAAEGADASSEPAAAADDAAAAEPPAAE